MSIVSQDILLIFNIEDCDRKTLGDLLYFYDCMKVSKIRYFCDTIFAVFIPILELIFSHFVGNNWENNIKTLIFSQ